MASKKDNIKALFSNTRTRVIILFTLVLVIITILIGFFKLNKSMEAGTEATATVGNTPNIQSTPGNINPTPQYAELQEAQNRAQAEQANKEGTSAIPTIIRTQTLNEGAQVIGSQGGESGLGFIKLAQEDDLGKEQSLWIQTLKENSCNKTSMDAALAKGASILDLRAACTCIQLKENGYELKELEPACPCKDLKAAGFNARQLKDAGYSAERLRLCGFDACELRNAGFTAQEMKDGGFSDGELKGAGYSAEDILRASGLPDNLTTDDVRKAGCNSEELIKLRKSGVSAAAIRRINGCSLETLKNAGFTANDLKNAGYTAAELKRAGFGPYDLRKAGYTARDLLNAGVLPEDLMVAGGTNTEIQAAEAELPPGITVNDIKKGGCDLDVLARERLAGVSAKLITQQVGCSAAALKAAGFRNNDLLNAGFNAEQIAQANALTDEDVRKASCDIEQIKKLLAAGVSATRIKSINGCNAAALCKAGFDVDSLKAAGYTTEQMQGVCFSPAELTNAGLYPAAVIAKGRTADCSITSLKAAKDSGMSTIAIRSTLGCSVKAMKDAGFNAKELKDGGFTEGDLRTAGFTEQQLKDAGFVPPPPPPPLSPPPVTSSVAPLTNPNIRTQTSNLPKLPTIPGGTTSQSRLAQEGLANTQQLNSILEQQNKRAAEQKYQQVITQRTSDMLSAANQSMQAWAQVDTQTYEQGNAEEVKEGSSSITTLTGNPAITGQQVSDNNQSGMSTPPLIRAGDMMFAVIDTSVDSDEPSPILATIVAGKFKGAKLIGSFNLPANGDKMVITFNTMSVPGAAGATAINAYAIDENTTRTALSSRTNHHYLSRYGSLFASSFIEGLGNAIQSAGTTITIGGTGGLTNTQIQSNRAGNVSLENAVIALATVGKSWGQQAQQNMNRPTTVQVFSGTGVGILFTQDLRTL